MKSPMISSMDSSTAAVPAPAVRLHGRDSMLVGVTTPLTSLEREVFRTQTRETPWSRGRATIVSRAGVTVRAAAGIRAPRAPVF